MIRSREPFNIVFTRADCYVVTWTLQLMRACVWLGKTTSQNELYIFLAIKFCFYIPRLNY